MSRNLATDRAAMVNGLKQLTNNHLKELCKGEGLIVSGIKAALQDRLIQYADELLSRNDTAAFDRFRMRVLYVRNPGMASSQANGRSNAYGSMSTGHSAQGHNRPTLPVPGHSAASGRRHAYKKSPFYEILDTIAGPADVPERPSNRDVVNLAIRLSSNHVEQLRGDSSLRVMLYCTSTSLMTQYNALHDISFPDVEVRVNQEEVKSNYRGLKNKPGTTKPADLTDFLRKSPVGYSNQLQFTYARTSKPYTFVVNLVKKTSADALIERIRKGRVISKDKVIQEMINRAKDPDIEAMSTIMSLKDPISTMRIVTPCRSVVCTHNQCFDASYFILLQEQAPTWICPICNKTISYEALAVDHYVLDILQKTSKSVDQVTIEPEGSWSEVKQDGEKQSQSRAAYDNDSDDDLIELNGPGGSGGVPIKSEASQPPSSAAQPTPPHSSREPSSRPNGGFSNKRPSAVIDLTLSDDDEPVRPAKRHQSLAGAASASYQSPSSQQELRRPHSQSIQTQLPMLQTQHTPSPANHRATFGQASGPGQYHPYSAQPYQSTFSSMAQQGASSFGSQTAGATPNGQQLSWPLNFTSYSQPWRPNGANNNSHSGNSGSSDNNNNNNTTTTTNHNSNTQMNGQQWSS